MDKFNNGIFSHLTLTIEILHDGLLKRKPTKRNENIITTSMIKHISLQLYCNLQY